jgi:4-hydroxy-4-methyl-2-oxoglutarate aldolase
MNGPVMIANIERPSSDVISKLVRFGTSTIHEAQGRTGLMDIYMRPIYAGAAVAGTAITVSLPPGDNLTIHVAVEACQPGDVLVVTPTSSCTDGYFGELLATSLKAKGVQALIIEAGCRDIRALTEMKFPVWSRAISSQGTVKATLGSVNVPVVCAGAYVRPGDVVIADDDGIVVVPRENARTVAQASTERSKKETVTRKRLARGESGLDVYGWRDRIRELGLKVYEDEAQLASAANGHRPLSD